MRNSAKTWEQAWLAYRPMKDQSGRRYFSVIHCSGNGGAAMRHAAEELSKAARELYGLEPAVVWEGHGKADAAFSENQPEPEMPGHGADRKSVSGPGDAGRENEDGTGIFLTLRSGYPDEGYRIRADERSVTIEGSTGIGLLYGAFFLIRLVRLGRRLPGTDLLRNPRMRLRMQNHWDGSDGVIERGYSGRSFFISSDGQVLVNERTRDYCRLMASIGINGVVINNVNVTGKACFFITDQFLPQIRRLSDLMREYGIRLFLAIDYAASIDVGGLDTADPLDPRVIAWWRERMEAIHEAVPDLGGFIVKADSEGRPGPFTYGRNQAQGANLLADAMKPYGWTLIWRCFVYNCNQDWRDLSVDRARSAYDYFAPLDGQFADNVILQIKNGPIDFQPREPISPLFGRLKHTRCMLEVQIAQEYTGHQIDVCCLIPEFREILHQRTYLSESGDTVAERIGNEGMAAVSNMGDDPNWTGNDLAGANLYGFGELAWNPDADCREIISGWAVQNFNCGADTAEKITEIQMMSWPAYEKYYAPLGVGFMVTSHDHYGVSVDGYEYDRWGTYHCADCFGVGRDRTLRTGTGFTALYNPPLSDLYENIRTCPDNLLLFFHHVSYRHILHSGETLIQHIYNSHFEGYEDVETMSSLLDEAKGGLEERCYRRMRERMDLQLADAREWRDQINTYFYRHSGIPDEKGRKIYGIVECEP